MTPGRLTNVCGAIPALLTLCSAHAFAQDGPKPSSQPQPVADATPSIIPRTAALAAARQACSKMMTLQGVEFSTVESQDNSMSRGLGRMGGNRDSEVDGRWSPHSLHALVGQDDEVVLHRGRMIARDDDSDWVLRHNCVASGSDLPFLFDPSRFFELLTKLNQNGLQAKRHVLETKHDRTMLVISYTAIGDAADELLLAGGIPRVRGMGSFIAIGGLGRMPRPQTDIDLSISIDQASHLIYSIHIKAYQTSAVAGMVAIQGMGGGAPEEDEKPVRTTDEHGNRIYKRGLPVREVEDDQSVMSFDVRLKNHDKPMRPELDETGRRLLRMK